MFGGIGKEMVKIWSIPRRPRGILKLSFMISFFSKFMISFFSKGL